VKIKATAAFAALRHVRYFKIVYLNCFINYLFAKKRKIHCISEELGEIRSPFQ